MYGRRQPRGVRAGELHGGEQVHSGASSLWQRAEVGADHPDRGGPAFFAANAPAVPSGRPVFSREERHPPTVKSGRRKPSAFHKGGRGLPTPSASFSYKTENLQTKRRQRHEETSGIVAAGGADAHQHAAYRRVGGGRLPQQRGHRTVRCVHAGRHRRCGAGGLFRRVGGHRHRGQRGHAGLCQGRRQAEVRQHCEERHVYAVHPDGDDGEGGGVVLRLPA